MTYSGFFRRLVACIIDSLILFLPSLFLGGGHWAVGTGAGVFISFFYYPFFESSTMCATPGKALMGMVVLTENFERLSFKSAVLRLFMRYVSAIVLYIGYFMQVFTTKRQTLHDIISESVVVDKETPADINYFRVWKEQIKSIFNKL